MMANDNRIIDTICDPTSNRRTRMSEFEREKLATGHIVRESRPSAENMLLVKSSITSTRRNPRNNFKIATWNVRTLFEPGKLANACRELKMLKLDILEISETRWPESRTIKAMGKLFYYSGYNDHIAETE